MIRNPDGGLGNLYNIIWFLKVRNPWRITTLFWR